MASYGYDQPEDEKQGIAKEPTLPPYQPSEGFNPPSQTGFPAPQAGYPPQSVGYPPQQVAFSPQQVAYSPQQVQSTNTVVVNQQPQRMTFVGPRNWGTPLCSCFDDMSICLCGAFCSTCLASQVSQDMGEHCCVPCCVPGGLVALRLKMRTQENIEGSLMNDCCTVAFCGPCALCQLAREVNVVSRRRMVITHQPC